MPSFFNPLAGLSCLSCTAVAVDPASEQEMMESLAGRSSTTSNKSDSDDDTPLLPSTKERAMYPDKSTNRSSRSIYSTTSRRRCSMRSTLSRADSCMSIQSGISVRSSPWYMKHISSSILFSDGENDADDCTDHRLISHELPFSSTRLDEVDREVTTEEYDDEEDECIFCDSTSGSDYSDTREPLKTTVANKDNDDYNSNEPYLVSSLLGPTIVRLKASDNETKVTTYHSDQTLQNSALVGLYFAKADQCQQTTEYVRLFTAGYYHSSLDSYDSDDDIKHDPNELQALSIIYCNANDDDVIAVPSNMPTEWYTLPQSKSTIEIQRHIRNELDIVTTAGPTLVVFDPISGRIVCSNAILDIIHLDRSDVDQYDTEAYQLYDSWLQQLLLPDVDDDSGRLQLFNVVDEDGGLVTVEYVDGERSSYERLLPYSI